MSKLYVESGQLQSSDGAVKTPVNSLQVGSFNILSNGGITVPKTANVTQTTSITTGVTSNGVAGQITTVTATTASAQTSSFTVTNSAVTSSSYVFLQLVSYSGTIYTNGIPLLTVSNITSGSFQINILNAGANALNGSLVITYLVV